LPFPFSHLSSASISFTIRIERNYLYLARPELSNNDIVMDWSNGVVLVDFSLLSNGNPFQSTGIDGGVGVDLFNRKAFNCFFVSFKIFFLLFTLNMELEFDTIILVFLVSILSD